MGPMIRGFCTLMFYFVDEKTSGIFYFSFILYARIDYFWR